MSIGTDRARNIVQHAVAFHGPGLGESYVTAVIVPAIAAARGDRISVGDTRVEIWYQVPQTLH